MLSTVLVFVSAGLAASAVALRRRRRMALVLAGCSLLGVLIFVVVTDPFDIRKLVAGLVMPVGLLWLGLTALAWRLAELGLRRLALLAWALWMGLTVAGNGRVGHLALGLLEHPWARSDPFQLERLDAVLVLGGGVGRHESGQVSLSGAGDRLVLAARLYHAGIIETLVTSGLVIPPGTEGDTSVPELTERVWTDLGVPRNAILQVVGPRSTTEEVAELARLMREHEWRRVGLLTSGYHLRRAMALCRRQGLEVIPIAADLSSEAWPIRPVDLVPGVDGLAAVHCVAWEVLGRAAGR